MEGSRSTADGGTPAGDKKRRRGGPRRKTGCYTCKARHARCDEKKPICSNCERLNLQCRAYEFIKPSAWCEPVDQQAEPPAPRPPPDPAKSPITPKSTWDIFNNCVPDLIGDDAVDRSSSSSSSAATPAIPAATLHTAPQTISLSSEAAHLLTVYQTGVATWMDLFDHGCAYQREVPRRCMTSELVLKSVCAFTAKHLSLLPSGEIWAAPAARYYGDSLRLFIRYLNSSLIQTDALTATMLLGSYEMIAAKGQEHQRHFYGAMVLIHTHGITAQSLGMDRANFWIYVRHEITVAMVNETPLRISPADWNVSWRDGEAEEDGLANRLLWLIGRAIDLAYASNPPPSAGTERLGIHDEAIQWFDSLPVSFRGVKIGQPDDQGFTQIHFAVSAAAAAMMWYHLLHILLCAEPTLQHPSQKAEVQYRASEIGSIALSDVPQSVRSFSAQALIYAAKHIDGIGRKTKLWAVLDDLETRHGFSTRSHIRKLQHAVETDTLIKLT